MEATYEVRFGIKSKRKVQEYRVFTTDANNFAEAVRKFVVWANDGEEKKDWKGRPFQFDKYPVTEDSATSIVRLSW